VSFDATGLSGLRLGHHERLLATTTEERKFATTMG
jgi:hypothetical protein